MPAAAKDRQRQQRRRNFTPSTTNLLVRCLPQEVDDNRLREIFSAFGNITSSMVMRDIHSGQSLGTAFVRYATHEEALRAQQDMRGVALFGKTISVQWAKQQHDDTPAGQDRLKMNKLFLRNVPVDVTEDELVELVRVHGSVVKVSMHNDTTPVTDPSLRRRIAFITFAEQGAAESALRAVHNTCAFLKCDGIPLMGKLSEDYSQKNRAGAHVPASGGRHHHRSCTGSPRSDPRASPRTPNAVSRGATCHSDDTVSSVLSLVSPVLSATAPLLESIGGLSAHAESSDLERESVVAACFLNDSRGCNSFLQSPTSPASPASPSLKSSFLYRHNPYDPSRVRSPII